MSVTLYRHGGLSITAAAGWLDVTDQIEVDDPPFTLTKADGVGALQFSVAEYERGNEPAFTARSLRALLDDFALSRELGRGFDCTQSDTPMLSSACSFSDSDNFARVWYCSNGTDVVLVTYTCQKSAGYSELPDCERMVSQLRFE